MLSSYFYTTLAALFIGTAHASAEEPASTNVRTVTNIRIQSPDLELPAGLQKPGLCAGESKELMLNDSGLRSVSATSVIPHNSDGSLLAIGGSTLGD